MYHISLPKCQGLVLDETGSFVHSSAANSIEQGGIAIEIHHSELRLRNTRATRAVVAFGGGERVGEFGGWSGFLDELSLIDSIGFHGFTHNLGVSSTSPRLI